MESQTIAVTGPTVEDVDIGEYRVNCPAGGCTVSLPVPTHDNLQKITISSGSTVMLTVPNGRKETDDCLMVFWCVVCWLLGFWLGKHERA